MLRAMAERLVYSSIPVNVNSLSCIVIGAQEQGGRTIRSEPVQRNLPSVIVLVLVVVLVLDGFGGARLQTVAGSV
jgi:hypothetical protein